MQYYIIIPLVLMFFSSLAQTNEAENHSIHNATIYFDFGSSEILASEHAKIQQLMLGIDSSFNGYVKMVGHTDNIGKDANNLALSEKRIDAIINCFIVEKKNNIYFVRNPKGEHLPIADNTTKEGRRQNRRVELQLFRKEKKPIVPIESYSQKAIPIDDGTLITFIIKDQLTDELIYSEIISSFDEQNHSTYEAGKCDIWYDLDEAKNIKYEFYSKGYFHQYSSLKILPQEEKEIIIYLTPIKEGAILNLTEVLFKGGKTILMESSIPELQRLLKTLKENENFTFEIGGHVNIRKQKIEDPKGTSSSRNKRVIKTTDKTAGIPLSEARAKKILQYLEENGIAAERMTFKGYGNSKMPYPFATSKTQMAANRRVEIKVTKTL